LGRDAYAGIRLAVRADQPHQPLREHRHQRGRDEIVFHAHVGEPGDGAGRVVGVQRGEHQVAGEGRADGDVGRLAVADFTHLDHVPGPLRTM